MENVSDLSGETRLCVDWCDVEAAAKTAFSIWLPNRDYLWAQEAWQRLFRTGLTDYETETKHCQVQIRFLCLASLYRDWCSLADDELLDDELTWWADELDISTFRLAQLVGPDFGEGETDEYELRRYALQSLTEDARADVVQALKKSYGSDADLFLALWRINHPAPPKPAAPFLSLKTTEVSNTALSLFDLTLETDKEEDDDDTYYEDDNEVLNDVTDEKLAAYAWIDDDCPSVRPPSELF